MSAQIFVLNIVCTHVSTKTDPPPVLKPPVNVTSSVGGVAVLSCQVEGNMRHNLTWYRGGYAIRARAGRVKLLPNSYLQISAVRAQDAGEYRCVATNAYGDSRIAVWLHVPGMIAQYPAAHLLKHLTRQGLTDPRGPPSSVFHYCLDLLAIRLSHFLFSSAKTYACWKVWRLLRECTQIFAMTSTNRQINMSSRIPCSYEVRHGVFL